MTSRQDYRWNGLFHLHRLSDLLKDIAMAANNRSYVKSFELADGDVFGDQLSVELLAALLDMPVINV